MESPYPSKKFELRHNVENLILGIDSSAVIVEDTGRVKKKKKNKNKRVLGADEVAQSDMELKLKAEAMIKKDDEDKERGRFSEQKPLGVRLREKFAQTFYGSKPEMSALDKLIEKERAEKAAN